MVVSIEEEYSHQDFSGSAPFPIEEFASRMARVRSEMRARGIGVLFITSPVNMYYLTGYRTVGYYMYQALLVPQDGDPLFIIRKFELPNVKGLSWAKACATYEDSDDPIQVTVAAVERLCGASATIGYDEKGFFTPPSILDALRKKLLRAKFVPAWGVVERGRLVKSDAEITCSRKAAEITVRGIAAAIDMARVGVTENELTAAMYSAMLQAGGEDPSNGPFAVAGPRSALPHQTAERVVIRDGDLVFVECGGCYHRYGAANVRTLSMGRPGPRVQRLSDTVLEALDAAIRAIRPGAKSGDVDRAARQVVERAGVDRYWLHRTGYSIGLGFPPTWGEGAIMDIKPRDQRPLEAGMIFHLVPGLIIPGLGSIMFSETVLVTRSGAEPLTNYERKLIIRE